MISRKSVSPWLVSVLVLSLAPTGCSDTPQVEQSSATASQTNTQDVPNDNPAHTTLINDALTQQIQPYFREALTSVQMLNTSVNTLCDSQAPTDLESARTAWKQAMTAWAKTQIVNLRPLSSDTRNPLFIYYFPDENKLTEKNVDELLSGDFALNTDIIKGSGGAESGLSGLEYVLFSKKQQTLSKRECALAKAQSAVLLADVAAYDALWSGQYAQDFSAGTGEFNDTKAAANAWFNSIVELAERMKGDKLGAPTGHDTGTAKSVFDARFSGMSKQVYQANLDTLSAALLGAKDGTGVSALLDKRTRQQLTSNIDTVKNALQAISADSFADTSAAKTKAVYDAQQKLVSTIKNEAAQAANFQVTFNNNDGD